MGEISIIIQPDGSTLVPRGTAADNQFFLDLFEDADPEILQSLSDFFQMNEESEILFGSPGLCG